MLVNFVVCFVLFSWQLCWTTVEGRAHKPRSIRLPEVHKVEYTLPEDQSIFDYWTTEPVDDAEENIESMKLNNTKRNKRNIQVVDELVGDFFRSLGQVTAKFGNTNYTPFQAYGKLDYLSPKGQEYYCTAAYVGQSDRILITAAHCVKTGSHWHTDFVFRQSYDRGVFWRETKILYTITNGNYGGTSTEEDYVLDYAFLVTEKENPRAALGITYDVDKISFKAVIAAGYPLLYNNGERLIYVKHNMFSRTPHFISTSGHKFIQLNHDMGPGCSGGPLIIECPDGFYAVGVNSFFYTNRTDEGSYSPIFDNDTFDVYSCAYDVAMKKCNPKKCLCPK